jgi:hypothetical protein
MAVMEVNLPSGYTPDEDGLQAIRVDNRLVKKVETDSNNRVAIYFDRVRHVSFIL